MVYIRADANQEIATGHIMRCMAIAKALQSLGEEVTFITADHCPDKLLGARGFSFLCLESDWQHLESEIEPMRALIREKSIEKLFIDSYAVTDAYLENISRESSVKIIFLDDFGQVKFPVRLLINYSDDAGKSVALTEKQRQCTQTLFGHAYVPLREEFENLSPVFREKVKAVFISTGGADKYNLSVQIIEKLACIPALSQVDFHVVAGNMSAHREELLAQTQARKNVTVYCDVTDMAKIMCRCDVAISACGSTMYELAACGLPILSFSVAANQYGNLLSFEKKGVSVNCGDVKKDKEKVFDRIAEGLVRLLSDTDRRRRMHDAALLLSDGQGSRRIAQSIIEI